VGYYQAGFTDIVGVDINPQKNYPFKFVQADALEYVIKYGHLFDTISASPPCQFNLTRKGKGHIDLIPDTRQAIKSTNKPYIIENVINANLINPLLLCGTMFNLEVIRHRLFETNIDIKQSTPQCNHIKSVVKHGRPPIRAKEYHGITGHFSDVKYARIAMSINWMTRDELSQAIPPAYTKWLGEQILSQI